MNWNNLNQAAAIATKIHNMHVTLKGQAKGLRRLSRRVDKLTQERDTLLAQRQSLTDLLDSRDHDIQTLKMEIAELSGPQILSSRDGFKQAGGGEPCDARR